MRKSRYLTTIGRSMRKKIRRYSREIDFALENWSELSFIERERRTSNVSIGLLNLWSNFSRAYYISSFCGAKYARGRSVYGPLIVSTEAEAIGFAIIEYNLKAKPKNDGLWDRRSEPKWHDKNFLMRITSAADLCLATRVKEAFSAGQKVFDHLPVFRNYYAHRNQQTLKAVQNLAPLYGFSVQEKPTDVLMEISKGRKYSVLDGWLNEIDITVEFLCNK